MNYGAEPADQVVRYTLEGTEFALKISGTAAKNFAVFALAVLRDQKKTHGKTKLVRLLREGKPLKFFSVPTDQMRDFAKAAKSHGHLYVPIRDRSDPDNIEIAVWAEDAAKVNRVIDKLQLDVVDTGEAELVADVQKGQSQDCQGQPNREEWPQAESRTDQRMTRGDFQDFSRKIHDEQQLACQNRQANEAMEIDK